jgi:hypothetical protein
MDHFRAFCLRRFRQSNHDAVGAGDGVNAVADQL